MLGFTCINLFTGVKLRGLLGNFVHLPLVHQRDSQYEFYILVPEHKPPSRA